MGDSDCLIDLPEGIEMPAKSCVDFNNPPPQGQTPKQKKSEFALYTKFIIVFCFAFAHFTSEPATFLLRNYAEIASNYSQLALYLSQLIINFACLIGLAAFLYYCNSTFYLRTVSFNLSLPVPFALFAFGALIISDLGAMLDESLCPVIGQESLGIACNIIQLLINLFGYGFQILLHSHEPWTVPPHMLNYGVTISKQKLADKEQLERELRKKDPHYLFHIDKVIDRPIAPYYHLSIFQSQARGFQLGLCLLQGLFTIFVLFVNLPQQLESSSFTASYIASVSENALVIFLLQMAFQKFVRLQLPTDYVTISMWRFWKATKANHSCNVVYTSLKNATIKGRSPYEVMSIFQLKAISSEQSHSEAQVDAFRSTQARRSTQAERKYVFPF